MPHKHTRRKGGDDSKFNLAPSSIAKPLPTSSSSSKKKKSRNSGASSKSTSQNGYKYDDTPRAFARMMQAQTSKKRPRSDLDNGEDRRSKKQKKSEAATLGTSHAAIAPKQPPQTEMPKIQPGERLGAFAARVDHALPVAGLARKGKVKVEGIKERQTKAEKRLHKMYASWREEDAKRKEREEEEKEQEEEAEEEREAELGGQSVRLPVSNRKSKRNKVIGEDGDDDDPWAQLKLQRDMPKGLHDVVQAPPSFRAVPKEKFKVRNGAGVQVMNVPTAAGSLKRREELSAARREVIENYRNMMKRHG